MVPNQKVTTASPNRHMELGSDDVTGQGKQHFRSCVKSFVKEL